MSQVQFQEPPTGPNPPAPAEPALIAGKFKTQDDLVKAYKELESKVGAPKQPETPPATPEVPATPAPVTPQVDPKLDTTKYEQEFRSTGKLSDASYKELADKGVTKAQVDQYIQGAQTTASKILETVGGEEQFQSIVKWAETNLSDAEKDAYNKAVDSNDPALAQLALAGLQSKYTASVGKEPSLIGGRGSGTGAGYQSHHEMLADMNDPRYKAGDPAFHAMVYKKAQSLI